MCRQDYMPSVDSSTYQLHRGGPVNTITSQKPQMCLYCGEWFANLLLANEHWTEVHGSEHQEFRKRRMERFGY